jgi:hypothetical protein
MSDPIIEQLKTRAFEPVSQTILDALERQVNTDTIQEQ